MQLFPERPAWLRVKPLNHYTRRCVHLCWKLFFSTEEKSSTEPWNVPPPVLKSPHSRSTLGQLFYGYCFPVGPEPRENLLRSLFKRKRSSWPSLQQRLRTSLFSGRLKTKKLARWYFWAPRRVRDGTPCESMLWPQSPNVLRLPDCMFSFWFTAAAPVKPCFASERAGSAEASSVTRFVRFCRLISNFATFPSPLSINAVLAFILYVMIFCFFHFPACMDVFGIIRNA